MPPDEPGIYSLTSTPIPDADRRAAELQLPYEIYRLFTRNKLWCGSVLEEIVRASFAMVPDYTVSPPRNPAEPLDGIYVLRGLRVGLEVKNIRSWLYPHAEEIWETLRKCLLEDAMPLLVARKLHWLTFRVFSAIGAMGFEFHRQVFAENTAPYLPQIQHTDILGFKDVIALPVAAHAPLVQFLERTFRNNADEFTRRWTRSRATVEEYAVRKNLASLPAAERIAESAEFVRALLREGGPEGWEDYFDL